MARGQVWAETGVGAVVIAAAAAFLIYALSHSNGQAGGGYAVFARFGQVGSLAAGADVRLAGVKVGAVSGVDLDPKTFLARTTLSIDRKIKLPVDSTVKITSDGLLGGEHVSIEPGGSLDDMKPGAEFQNVQGAVDLFSLIGAFLRPGSGGTDSNTTGSSAASSPASGSTATPSPAAPAAGTYGSP